MDQKVDHFKIPENVVAYSHVNNSERALVIGAGFGGLAVAIRLALKGYDVQVLERLGSAGGRAYVHRRNGFTFDAGPTIITAPFLLEELWDMCGKKMSDDVDLRAMDPFYQIRFADGRVFNYTGDLERMKVEVAKFSPKDLPGYLRFLDEAESCYKLAFEDLGDVAFDNVQDLVKAMPNLIKMRAWKSLYSVVAKYIKDPQLREVMSFHPLLIGGNPFSVSSAYALINSLERKWGVHSAMGGTGSIIKGMVGLLNGLGVSIRYASTVKKINIVDNKVTGVTLENGDVLYANKVVSNADTAWTYKNLIDPEYRKVWTDKKIENGKYSMSLFVWYFGTKKQYPQVPHHMMLLGERYKELLNDIFKRHHLAKDFSLYLHRPTATDPSLAPEGCDTFYVLSPVPHLDSGTDWSEVAESYRKSIAKMLGETVLPGLEENLVESFVMTPQDFQDRLLSYKGAAFGLEPLLTQSAWFRPHNRSEDIEGLYMVGASTHPGAGIPGVLSSAKALDSLITPAKMVSNHAR
ncbi:phytoene dehydrogenase [Polynucleobacter hirudinilacicola]|uniref:Phytoene dehydrogenase n=1 Tax=Polynucleobacter hirudinilacicola TaxID=1743166 RepID=A0A210RWL2_9BURK|nr:phytoene desaturase [Polynucleobacter hirudinilacicola]OWF65389.1 phytoene dehydrogenase [Polynucleobacter hirudinilacicola]